MAEGIIEVFKRADTQVATKMDLELFHKDTKAELAQLESKMDARFQEVDARFQEMDVRSENLELRLTNVIVKAQLAGFLAIVAVFSAFKFFT